MPISEDDVRHLRRCVELAREALDAGDEPFGSILVDSAGQTLFEDHNRVSGGDATRHPEFEIAKWAAARLDPDDRRTATVYTSGEHCVMCSAAHAWVGLGRIVYATSSTQLVDWLTAWGAPLPPVATLPISAVATGVTAVCPVPDLAEPMRALYEAKFR